MLVEGGSPHKKASHLKSWQLEQTTLSTLPHQCVKTQNWDILAQLRSTICFAVNNKEKPFVLHWALDYIWNKCKAEAAFRSAKKNVVFTLLGVWCPSVSSLADRLEKNERWCRAYWLAKDIISHKFTEETQNTLLYEVKVKCKALMPRDPIEWEVIFFTKICLHIHNKSQQVLSWPLKGLLAPSLT